MAQQSFMMENLRTSVQSSSRISDASLLKSVRLLDDALNSPAKSTLRITKSTPLRRSLIRRRQDSVTSERSLVRALGDTPTKVSQTYKDLSLTIDPVELGDSTLTTGGLLVGYNPAEEISNRLFFEFLESMQNHGSEQQVFETVSDFIQNCSNVLDLLSMDCKYPENAGSVYDSVWLVNEHSTWCLVYCLYQNRLSSQRNVTAMEQDVQPIPSRQLSEKEVVIELYKNDTVTKECQLVVDWLEQQASRSAEGMPNIQHYTDKTVAWENTLHQLQNKDRSIPYSSTRPILDKLDPDAPLRERKPLHDLDSEDEDKLIKAVFVEIRCGRLEEAQNLCVHCGQPWRAATLEGWRLYHDPNYVIRSNTGEKLPVEGNPNRDLWKLMAWRLATDPRIPPYARATHAALCGHLEALETVCNTWPDMLWAYLRVMVDIRVEKELRATMSRSYVPMPEAYWRNNLTLEEVFSKLSASNNSTISSAAMSPGYIVQKYLILDQIPQLMEEMLKWTRNCNTQFLRFLAHLVLFFRLIGCSFRDEIGDEILEAYVKVLMNMQNPTLVAFYVATLPQEDQINLYAQFLEQVTDKNERQLCLSVAEDADLDVSTITKTVVENIRNRECINEFPDLHAETTPQDLEKISALDWVVFYDSQCAEAIWQANAMIRQFLAAGKLEAARKAFNKIPIDSIDMIIRCYRPSGAKESDELSEIQYLPQRVASSIREYLSHRAYLDAQEGFSEWFHHYHNAKPKAPMLPSGEVTFTERVAYDHRSDQYKLQLEHWKNYIQQQTKTVKAQLFNVLTFPEGGWLIDVMTEKGIDEEATEAEEEENKCRQQQMESLRRLCIPQVVLLLATLLQNVGEYTQCIQVADLVVSEQYELYKVYTPQKLGELLKKLCESVHDLVLQKNDPWGHPSSSL